MAKSWHARAEFAYQAVGLKPFASSSSMPRPLGAILFFHECGRRVGGVPRSSLKGKETLLDEGEKNTSDPKQQNPTKPKQEPQTKKPPQPEADSPVLSKQQICEKLQIQKLGSTLTKDAAVSLP